MESAPADPLAHSMSEDRAPAAADQPSVAASNAPGREAAAAQQTSVDRAPGPVPDVPGFGSTGRTDDRPQRIAFLGPFGTFTEQAVRQVAPVGAELLPMTSAPQALAAVRRGQADRAVVPIENSIEGGVNATLDSLSHGEPLVIVAEMVVDVVFQLAVRPGTTADAIGRIGTHPHAWAQCRTWAEATFPGAIHVPTTSTAAAAELLAAGDAPFDAVLCNAMSVAAYGLDALHSDVADTPGAVTRFVLVSRPGEIPEPTGADKTTIQVALPVNESGALLTLLEQFAVRGVDLSRIESRPSGDGLGDYTFSIDIVGHIAEERVQASLVGLHRYSPEVRFMGSYPRVDGVEATVLRGTRDEDFQRGRAWVAGILRGGDGASVPAGEAPGWPLR
ncbi:prephenate dehydratase [Actinomyces sp. B33]|uniref:prephenate dehydratase n=1 Tax=Actinomyces sp. B33 TaxID=2942131 RepID=UPI00233FD11A|nr:prephenate dehydratase [Actinomyces sp. B33]MDC4233401.1 prephenate dehydratase [Actinomyces sp. B33]